MTLGLCAGLGLMCLALVPAVAQEAPRCEAKAHRGAKVTAIVDAETLQLADGRRVRLVGSDVPREPEFARNAAALLEKLALGKKVALHYSKKRTDRHGRIAAQIYVDAGVNHREQSLWLQGELLRLGLARAFSFKHNRDCIGALLAREEEARRARRGLWADERFSVRKARDVKALLREIQTFQIIEGRVLSTGKTRRNAYLNFGPIWKTDFTGIIKASDLDEFERGGMIIEDLKGVRVRLRGWLVRRGGPALELTHPGQLEILDRW